ncbi:MAG: ABC transporter substrate-binding protein [Candidatus Magnetomorum sp.]|nr:ABC transporter substrate-binding protein [Candidatus Magnetomorum sp.]
MKKLIWVIFFIVTFSSISIANEVVRLAIGDWSPYTSKSDTKGKLLEKVVTEAFKLEQIDVNYFYFPWKRSFVLAKKGDYDGTFPWNKTNERDNEFYIHKHSLIKDEGVYFHLKSKSFDWNTIEDLKKYKVGVTIGYKQEKTYKDKGILADAVVSEALNFKKIMAGRIDVYQTSKDVGYATIHQLFSPDQAKLFTTHPKPVEESEYFILFSRKSPKGKYFSEKFDAGLMKLKESGAYDRIIAEHRSGS